MTKIFTFFFLIFSATFAVEISGDRESAKYALLNAAHNEKSGFFVGVHLGVSLYYTILHNAAGQNIAWDSQNSNQIVGKNMQVMTNVGIKLGYSHFFNALIGVRGYINYDYSDYREVLKDSKIASEDVSINSDVMINFYNGKRGSFGLFIGFGVGYNLPQFENAQTRINLESTHKYNGFIMPLNLGLSFSSSPHKIELGTRIPTLLGRYKSNADSSGFSLKPVIISLEYMYIF
ncbi:outer membrane beta-barrel protein [Helicobacter saguini]|uniref:Outer membrane beta-barrel protein n=1 Tax=Helicobacter saguini TaxID=1548018 RepID=A0A347VPY2_9HELI|nr:outer membrane beta-barrel protein [Helicobacter saguini]MWV61162.1 outer membrane beta-barrel protein [Helicobacter saguini]MWV68170.1 outer membrane beta-barrel protein [Helicobacter saguini]MWV70366.1 outer membrane beta-barrel protein [Helicobacter saguini]MWV72268.1 outer membrane beta-barrel protein [Helicobacter saguini]TLD95310.1 outer membrane beta-barrel protein [Helicobacter saguini]